MYAREGRSSTVSEPRELLCMECARTYRDVSFCPEHPNEPLLDPNDDIVIQSLMEEDDRVRDRMSSRWMLALGVGLCAADLVVTYLLLRDTFLMHPKIGFYSAGGAAAIGAGAGKVIAGYRFTPKYRQWTAGIDPE